MPPLKYKSHDYITPTITLSDFPLYTQFEGVMSEQAFNNQTHCSSIDRPVT